jgi:ribosomal protein S27E
MSEGSQKWKPKKCPNCGSVDVIFSEKVIGEWTYEQTSDGIEIINNEPEHQGNLNAECGDCSHEWSVEGDGYQFILDGLKQGECNGG